MNDDPRKNAPPCISHFSLQERKERMAARNEARRVAYMRYCEREMVRHRTPAQPFLARVLGRFYPGQAA